MATKQKTGRTFAQVTVMTVYHPVHPLEPSLVSTTDWIRLAVLSFLWSVSFILVEVALEEAGPFTVVWARVGFAAAALLIYCAVMGLRVAVTPRLLLTFGAMGMISNAIPFGLITLGQTQITGSLAGILNATTPLFTVAVAHLWGQSERATTAKIAGVLVGLVGVAILIGVESVGSGTPALFGQLAVLAASLSYAFAAILGKRLTGMPPEAAAAGMLCAATLFIAPVALTLESPFAVLPSLGTITALLVLSVVSTAIAYILYFRLLASAGATNTVLVTFLIPANAVLLGATFLGEPFELHHLAGLLIILMGLALVDGRVLRLRAASGS